MLVVRVLLVGIAPFRLVFHCCFTLCLQDRHNPGLRPPTGAEQRPAGGTGAAEGACCSDRRGRQRAAWHICEHGRSSKGSSSRTPPLDGVRAAGMQAHAQAYTGMCR